MFIEEVKVTADGQTVPIETVRLTPPLPVTADSRWSVASARWTYYAGYTHLADMWPWYTYVLGLPVYKARAFIVTALALLIVLETAGAIFLARVIRRAGA